MNWRSGWLVCVFGLAACAGGGQSTKVADATEVTAETTAAAQESTPIEPHANPLADPVPELMENRCASRTGDNDTLVLSKQDGYATLLVGEEWVIQCDDDHMLLAESPYGVHITIQGSVPKTPVIASEYLSKMATKVADTMVIRGFPVSEPSAVTIRVAHQTVEAIFLSIDLSQVAGNMMQLNYWTVRQRDDGVVLDFHMSAVVPTDQSPQLVDATILMMERTTGLFTLLEDLDIPE